METILAILVVIIIIQFVVFFIGKGVSASRRAQLSSEFRSLSLHDLINHSVIKNGWDKVPVEIASATILGDTRTEYFEALLDIISQNISEPNKELSSYKFLLTQWIQLLESLSQYMERVWDFRNINAPIDKKRGVFVGSEHNPYIWYDKRDEPLYGSYSSYTYSDGKNTIKSNKYIELEGGFKLTPQPEQMLLSETFEWLTEMCRIHNNVLNAHQSTLMATEWNGGLFDHIWMQTTDKAIPMPLTKVLMQIKCSPSLIEDEIKRLSLQLGSMESDPEVSPQNINKKQCII